VLLTGKTASVLGDPDQLHTYTYVPDIGGLTNPGVREILEMRYLFAEPFVVDSTAIATELGATATPYAQALRETLDTYRVLAGRTPDPR
jgi:hypothetical protein